MNLNSFYAWLGLHPVAEAALSVVLLLLAALLSYFFTHTYLLRLLTRIIQRTEAKWDDAVLEGSTLRHAASAAPWLVIYFGQPLLPDLPVRLHVLLERGSLVLLVLSGILTLNSALSTLNAVYSRHEIARDRPIKGYVQVVKLFVFLFGGILVLSLALDKSPIGFLAGLGAMTAVLLLIFRDTILSLVASVQIATNDMVRIGDWIEIPDYGADGDVIDIALHTLKVQNWDKTITTVPTYKLIEGSFKNWRGMTESGGRRIMRSIFIDMTSVRFLTDAEVERFSRYELLAGYMAEKKAAIEAHNRGKNDVLTNKARRLTNLGTFRRYLLAYLESNPRIHPASARTLLVRQLQPGPSGIPVQIYAFSTDTRWAVYEDIQADIFDHVLSVISDFGLRVFQDPAGADVRALTGRALPGTS